MPSMSELSVAGYLGGAAGGGRGGGAGGEARSGAEGSGASGPHPRVLRQLRRRRRLLQQGARRPAELGLRLNPYDAPSALCFQINVSTSPKYYCMCQVSVEAPDMQTRGYQRS